MSSQQATILDEMEVLFREFFLDEDITLKPTTTLHDIGGWDSLTNISLMLAVQRKFAVRFSSRDQDAIRQVGDLAALIDEKRKQCATV